MLVELRLSNYALIDSLQVDFVRGLNVLTGETGAGKSIIVDALGYLLGDKAGASVVRKGGERCLFSAVFDLEGNPGARRHLKSLSLENVEDPGMLVIRREIDRQGKSKSFVNDQPVNLTVLSGLGDLLVEIHGQNEHQRLLRTADQRDFLDRYAGNESHREEVARLHADWQSLAGEKEASQISEQEKNQRIDLYRHQTREIASANLKEGEDEELERFLPRLKNAEKIQQVLDGLYHDLYDAEGSVLERLRIAQKSVHSLASMGADVQDSPDLLEETLVRVEELVSRVESLRKGISSDPGKVDEVISRQDQIDRLKRKYGGTIPQVLKYGLQARENLGKLESHTESLKEIEAKIGRTCADLVKRARALSATRKKAATSLSVALEKEFKDLGFHKAQFKVLLNPETDPEGKEAPTSTGLERVEFLFSANPGEDPKPLKNVASGGELSRIMLALKKILARVDHVPTMIFDEVDAGIGGSMGHVVGEKLRDIGRTHQVLAITHLPQIAAFGSRHIVVRKILADKRAMTAVELLEKDNRVKEIARMLGGMGSGDDHPSAASLKHASELLGKGSR